jgi:hypothetical protein
MAKFAEPVRAGLSALVAVEPSVIPQPYKGIVVLTVECAGREFGVAVDTYDSTALQQECLAEVSLYFKMQYLREGYGDERVVPGGYIAGTRALYDHHARFRGLRRRPYKFDVYGRFGTMFSAEVRRRAVEVLQADRRFAFTGGTSLSHHVKSLREAARARVCIDMPGQGPFCFRLVEYLAMGCCVIAPRHRTRMHAELVDGEHIVYCREDLSDLTDLCARYVEDDPARETVAANAARFYDEHLAPTQLADYYLRCISALQA